MAISLKSEAEKTKFVELALERFAQSAEAENEMRGKSLEDIEFSLGDQWPTTIAQNQAVMLTMNRMPQFIRQVTNEQRQQRPAVNVNPVGDGADVETADVFQGIIRHIEVNSDAEIAYDHAFEQMVRGGFGYFRLLTVKTETGLEIQIKRIKNQFTVYFDPTCEEPDYSDAKFAFIISNLTRREYEAEYPTSQAASMESFTTVGDQARDWLSKDSVRVAEYFCYMGDQVCWAKINGIEILEYTTWPGKYIPIIPVLGDDVEVKGKRHLSGLVRWAKDPQRMYNYWISKATERIALEPKVPWLAERKAIEGLEDYWTQANVRNMEVLVWDSHGGTVEAPARQAIQSDISGFVRLIAQADNDLKATTGIYDASLGQQGPEQSGRAIEARKVQGSLANLNWSDNLARSIRYCGRQLVDLIPKVYPKAAVQRIVKPDGSVSHVGIFNSSEGASAEDVEKTEAVKKVYDIGVGSYDVTVSVGPSYQTKRQEAVATQIELIKSVPLVAQAAPDIVVRNMDIPGADAIADRLKKTLPPQLQDGDEGDPQVQLQKAQGQLQQLSQQHDLLTKALSDATQTIQEKQIERQSKLEIAQMENQTRLSIEQLKIEAQLAVAEVETKAQAISERMHLVQDVWEQLHGSAHDLALQQQQHENTLEQGQQAADTQSALADQNAQNQQQMAAQQAEQQPAQ